MSSPAVVLLIGAPGTGKSVLGRHMDKIGKHEAEFVSVGDIPCSSGLLSTASAAELKIAAWEIVHSAVCKCVKNGKMLLLECIKEIDDAFSLMDVINDFGLALAQVLLIFITTSCLTCFGRTWRCCGGTLRLSCQQHQCCVIQSAKLTRDSQSGMQTLRNSSTFFRPWECSAKSWSLLPPTPTLLRVILIEMHVVVQESVTQTESAQEEV